MDQKANQASTKTCPSAKPSQTGGTGGEPASAFAGLNEAGWIAETDSRAALFGSSGGIGTPRWLGACRSRCRHDGWAAAGRVPDPRCHACGPSIWRARTRSLERRRAMADAPPDLVIVASGVLTLADGTGPERSYRQIDAARWTISSGQHDRPGSGGEAHAPASPAIGDASSRRCRRASARSATTASVAGTATAPERPPSTCCSRISRSSWAGRTSRVGGRGIASRHGGQRRCPNLSSPTCPKGN